MKFKEITVISPVLRIFLKVILVVVTTLYTLFVLKSQS